MKAEGDIPPLILIGNKVDLIGHSQVIINKWIQSFTTKYCIQIPVEITSLIYGFYCEYKREVTVNEAQYAAKKWNAIQYIETSAKSGMSVDKAFDSLIVNAVERMIKDTIKWNNKRKSKSCIIL